MLAIRLNNAQAQLIEAPLPAAPPGEARVRPTLMGVCSTDLELCKGYMGFTGTLGHEFVGVVDAVGSDADREWIGKRVVGTINCPTASCDMTARGWTGHARSRTVLGILGRDGCFAQAFLLPVANLLRVPDSVDDTTAVFTEPVAAAFEILEQITVQKSDRVTVLGDGRLGLLCAQVLRMHAERVRVVGKHPHKLAIAKSWGLETLTLDALTPSQDQDIVVDCTASGTAISTAIRMTRPRGVIVLKTTVAPDPSRPALDLSPIVINELTLVGSRCGPFQTALDALARGDIRVKELVGLRLPLSQGPRALKEATRKDLVKVLIEAEK